MTTNERVSKMKEKVTKFRTTFKISTLTETTKDENLCMFLDIQRKYSKITGT